MALKLHTVNIGGNLHDAATAINRWGWAEYLIHLDSVSGYNTIAVFRMPAEKVNQIRADMPSYVADPHHDDYRGPADPYSIFADNSGNTTKAGWPVEKMPPADVWKDFDAGKDAGNVAGSEVREQEGLPEHLRQDEPDAPGEAVQLHNPSAGEPGGPALPDPATVDPGETIMPPLPVVIETPKQTKKKNTKAADVPPPTPEQETPVDTSGLPEWAR